MSRPRSAEALLGAYVAALAEHHPGRAGALEREFLVGLRALARRAGLARGALARSELGLDLLHETVAELLAGPPEPPAGAVFRILGRKAYRLTERPPAPAEPGVFERRPAAATAGRDPLLPGLSPARRRLLDAILETDERHAGGTVHWERFCRRAGLSEKRVRRFVREVAAALGRDRRQALFWTRRLAEALTDFARLATEERVPDLLPSGLEFGELRRRTRRILARLRFAQPLPEYAAGLRRARALARRGRYPRAAVLEALAGLPADRIPILLVELEWRRARGEFDAGFALVAALEGELAREARDRPLLAFAERRLVEVAHARLLERAGRPGRAAELLAAGARRFARDPLYAYDRAVLALAAGWRRGARQALADLVRVDPARASPLLRSRMRRLLARGEGLQSPPEPRA